MKRILTLLILAALMPAMLTLPAIASERNFPPITEGCGNHREFRYACTGVMFDCIPDYCTLRGTTDNEGYYHPNNCTCLEYWYYCVEVCGICNVTVREDASHLCWYQHLEARLSVECCDCDIT